MMPQAAMIRVAQVEGVLANVGPVCERKAVAGVHGPQTSKIK